MCVFETKRKLKQKKITRVIRKTIFSILVTDTKIYFQIEISKLQIKGAIKKMYF